MSPRTTIRSAGSEMDPGSPLRSGRGDRGGPPVYRSARSHPKSPLPNLSYPNILEREDEEANVEGASGLETGHRFGLKLAELSRLWRQALDARLKPLGLSQARWAALIHLSAYPDGLTQGRLALRVGIRDSTLVPQLDALARDGLIERRGSPDDRRAKMVRLTPAAVPLLDEIDRVGRELRQELTEDIDPQNLDICLHVFNSIRNRLEVLNEDRDNGRNA